jgi:dipeptidyl aminopeptidase/acylaminoacyl peptidase
MKPYRVYEAFENCVGGIEDVGGDWEEIDAETAEEAAKKWWEENGWDWKDDDTVIVATDDDGDFYYLRV